MKTSVWIIPIILFSFYTNLHSQQLDFCGVMPKATAQSSDPNSVIYDRFGNSYDIFPQAGPPASVSSGTCYPSNIAPTVYENDVFEVRLFLDNNDFINNQDAIEEIFDYMQTVVNLPSVNCTVDGSQPKAIIDIVDCPLINDNGSINGQTAAVGSPFYFLPSSEGCESDGFYQRVTSVLESVMHTGTNPNGTPSGLICLNDNFTFSNNLLCDFDFNEDPANVVGFDFRTVILHELLHVFGFAATPSNNSGIVFLSAWDLNISYFDPTSPPAIPAYEVPNCNDTTNGCYEIGDSYATGINSNPCANAGVGLIIGSSGVSLIGGGNFSLGLADPINANAASHLCSVPGENTVMANLTCGDVRRVISPTELGLLSDLGHNIDGLTPACVQVVHDEFTYDRINRDCCNSNYVTCSDHSLIIPFQDLLCNDFTTSPSGFNIRSVTSTLNVDITIVGNLIELNFPDPKYDREYCFEYLVEGCDCTFSKGSFFVIISPCFDCSGVNPCRTLNCMDLELLDVGSYRGNFNNMQFTTPLSLVGNSPDIFADINNSSKFVGLSNSIEEAFSIQLSEPIQPNCTLNYNFDYGIFSANGTNNNIIVSASEFPPCPVGESPISSGGNTPTSCNNYVYDPIFLQDIDIAHNIQLPWSYLSSNFEIEFQNNQPFSNDFTWINDTGGPINYITIIAQNNGGIDFSFIGEVTATQNCTFLPEIEAEMVACDTYNFSVSNANPLGGFTYILDFDDGNSATGSEVTHTFDEDRTYEVTVTVRDQCGNEQSNSITVNVACGFNIICDEEEVDEIIIDATQGENRLSQLTNNLNPISETVIIAGDLRVDIDWSLLSCDILMEADASMFIEADVTMDMLGGSITRCNERWNTIAVSGMLPGTGIGTLRLQEVNPIEGAIDAVTINGLSNIEVTGCTFVDNIIGLSHGRRNNTFFPIGFNNLGMSQNTFIGAGESVAGIWFEDMFFFEMPIGGTGGGSTGFERFSNMQNGIVLHNVFNATLSNVLVEDIDDLTATAINHSCDDIDDPNCFGFGIFMDGGGLTLSSSEFINYNGIGLRTMNAFNGVNVTECNFRNLQCSDNDCRRDPAGIFSNSRGTIVNGKNTFFNCYRGVVGRDLVDITIQNNEFENSVLNLFAGNIVLSNIRTSTIDNNNIFDQLLASNQSTPAISIFNNNFNGQATIENNQLNLANNGVQNGISLNGVSNGLISANDVFSGNSGIGISGRNSFSNTYCCNSISDGTNGIRLTNNSTLSNLEANNFINNNTGLQLRNLTIDGIGIQLNNGNLWTGANSSASLINSPGIALDNSRIFHDPNVQEERPNNPLPTVWFQERDRPSITCIDKECVMAPSFDDEDCEEELYRIADIIERPYRDASGIDMHTLDLQLHILAYIDEILSDGQEEDCDKYQEVKEILDDEELNTLASIEKLIYHAQHIPMHLKSAYEMLAIENNQLSQTASWLLSDVSNDVSALQDLSNNVNQFHNAVTSLEVNISNYKEQVNEQVNVQLEEIDASDIKMHYLKEYYRITALMLVVPKKDISVVDVNMLREISQLCIGDYGRMVTSAMSLIAAYEPLDMIQDQNNCNEDIPVEERSNNVDLFTVIPNPSIGVFTIDLSEDYLIEKPNIVITDFSGRIIHEKSALKSNLIELEAQSSGIYFVQLISTNGLLDMKKIIIVD